MTIPTGSSQGYTGRLLRNLRGRIQRAITCKMRVKTVPRHMTVQSDLNATSSTENATSSNSLENNQEESAISNDSVKIRDVSELIQPADTLKDAMAGPSTCECFKWYTIEDRKSFTNDDDNNNLEVIDLSTRDCHFQPIEKDKVKENEKSENPEESYPSSIDPADKLKDTFLYKIMTDPMFLENIQKSKQQQQQQQQPKKSTCPFCHDEFSNDLELNEHMDGKKDETNQIVCCACKKSFARKRYLRYHQRCHSERTKFTCDICTRKYTRLDNLTRHNTFHVNPDKFPCTSCEKTFARKDLLNKHLKCHENKHRFYCEECVKYFKGPLTLDNHRKLYHADT
ncbi:hypothetical protein KPH14_005911 [Odynerus spinipes]|uniref:C2H2-type domain-containing protein n=1 Tax=Odynerus spinipes TaxID=1348599 RepID=A0AAD9RJ95_9HYME|nr:hypothetical protein KPH14_005911 [Odynerus spinipes]